METFTIVSLIHGMRHVIMECMIPSSPSSHFPQRGVTLSIVSMMPPSEAPCELRRTPLWRSCCPLPHRPTPIGPGPPARKKQEQRAARLKVKGKGGEDRPNAVTLISLRPPRESRLCQVTIISYTRWPFLNPTQLRSGGPTLGGP